MQGRHGDQTSRGTLGNSEESDVTGAQKGIIALLLRVTQEKKVNTDHQAPRMLG